MERIESINPDRIQWCLDDSGISLEQLAAGTKISPASLEKVMRGELGLTFKQIKKIGDYFGRGALFYLESGDVDKKRIRSTQFRSILNQQYAVDKKIKQIIQLAEWHRDIYIDLLEEIDRDDVIEFAPPDIAKLTIPQAAAKARAWLELEQPKSFNDYRQAIENKGILVFRTNGYAGKWQIPQENPILGFNLYYSVYPLIVVRKQRSEARQTFTLAHELGHLLLHKQSAIHTESDVQFDYQHESDANQFAGHFLVPDGFLEQIDLDKQPETPGELDAWLLDHKKAWGVSTEVILIRLINSGKIESRVYHAYRNWLNHRSFDDTAENYGRRIRYREPRHILGDNYVKIVMEALHANRITLTKASKYLDNLKVKDIHELGRYPVAN